MPESNRTQKIAAVAASSTGDRSMRSIVMLAGAFGAFCAVFFLALLIGAAPIPPGGVLSALAHPWSPDVDARIIWEVRLPRVCIGAVVGSALGIGGALLQTLLCNPLVDPYITGVSAGAGVAITLSIAGGIALPFVPALGFVAGILSASTVIALSLRAGRVDSQRLILAGLFVSTFLSAIVTIVLTRMEPSGAVNAILAWLAGSLAGHGWNELRWSLPYGLVGVVLAAFALPALNAMRLGEHRAASLGVEVTRTQWLVVGASALLTAMAVSLSGMIGFIGLLSPHIARRAVGADVRVLVPFAALVGASVVIAADVAARTIAPPGEIPIGALIALLGVPAFFYIAMYDRSGVRVTSPESAPHRIVLGALRRLRRRFV
jgi:iron complex transport system permease protein